MFRKWVPAIIVLLCAMPLFAGPILQNSIVYDFFLPQPSHAVTYRSDYLIGDSDGFSAGLTASVGYGVEHFTGFGSNALISGPVLRLGVVAQYDFSNRLFLNASSSVLADYALYPEVLRGEFSIDVGYRITGSLYSGLGASLLFPQWNAGIHAFLGVRQ